MAAMAGIEFLVVAREPFLFCPNATPSPALTDPTGGWAGVRPHVRPRCGAGRGGAAVARRLLRGGGARRQRARRRAQQPARRTDTPQAPATPGLVLEMCNGALLVRAWASGDRRGREPRPV
jgi:hypothetical protein